MLKAHMFRDSLLAYPGPGTPKDIEDRAFLQLIQGYNDDEQLLWISGVHY